MMHPKTLAPKHIDEEGNHFLCTIYCVSGLNDIGVSL